MVRKPRTNFENVLVKFFLVYIVLTASYEVLLC